MSPESSFITVAKMKCLKRFNVKHSSRLKTEVPNSSHSGVKGAKVAHDHCELMETSPDQAQVQIRPSRLHTDQVHLLVVSLGPAEPVQVDLQLDASLSLMSAIRTSWG